MAEPLDGLGFDERRLLCMVNSNRVEGIFSVRQAGMEGLPGIGRLFNGWHNRWRNFFAPAGADLYVERRRIARTAEAHPALSIDIFGKGWNGGQISWCPFYPNHRYRCHQGIYVENRLATLSQYRFSLAYENWRGDLGYITDRLFDGFLAGTVPVYLGDARIHDVVPADSFIDAASFKCRSALLEHLGTMSEPAWSKMRNAGRIFLKSDRMQKFSEENFARVMTDVIKAVAK
jgi:hypothetical protein